VTGPSPSPEPRVRLAGEPASEARRREQRRDLKRALDGAMAFVCERDDKTLGLMAQRPGAVREKLAAHLAG